MTQLRRRRIGASRAALAALFVAACTASPTPAPSGSVAGSPTPTTSVAPTASPTATTPASAEPTPLLEAADLDGRLVDPALAHRLPLAVSIDDARVARPQSGFNATSIVYQAPVDGYETRYLLVFQELDATDIGPTRSARLFLAQWAAEYRGAFGHYGGDRVTRRWLRLNRDDLFTDLDGIGHGNPAYHRISSRKAPHNAYTTTDDLRRVAERLGAIATIAADAYRRPFRDDTPYAKRTNAQSLVIPYKTVSVGYTYDRLTNRYLRTLDGVAHIDPMDGRQVTARTIVVMFMSFRTDSTIEPGHSRPVLGFVGSGKAWIISEGRLVEATWSKADDASPTRIVDASGTAIPFIRGRIFFQAVTLTTNVTVSVD